MNRCHTVTWFASGIAAAAFVTSASAQALTPEVPKSEPEYIAKVKTAAPAPVVNNATITMPQADGSSKTLQTGSNGYTCFISDDGVPECDDQNATEWRKALGAKQAPPNKIGFIFMLAGDAGTSNHDSSQRSTHQHWVQTGPHVMIVGSPEALAGYPATANPDTSKPYVMWPGTPYAHLMIPI